MTHEICLRIGGRFLRGQLFLQFAILAGLVEVFVLESWLSDLDKNNFLTKSYNEINTTDMVGKLIIVKMLGLTVDFVDKDDKEIKEIQSF